MPESEKVPHNPLFVLNSGDWIGQIYHKLPKVDYQPNISPQDMASRANGYPREQSVIHPPRVV